MTEIVSKPDYGVRLVIDANGEASPVLQIYLDDIERLLNDNLLGLQVVFPVYDFLKLPVIDGDEENPPVDELPTVPGAVFVTNSNHSESDPRPAYSDGTTWRFFSDDTIVGVFVP